MCCIWIKTASATVYAYRFHSWILPPKSQFLTAKNVCYHSLAKHPKTEIYHSCSFCWQTVLCFTYPMFTSIQLIFWMPQIPKGAWEVKKKNQNHQPTHLPFFFLYPPWKVKHPFFCNNTQREDRKIIRPNCNKFIVWRRSGGEDGDRKGKWKFLGHPNI